MFAINNRVLLSALSKQDISDLYQCENKRFNLFDDEIAQAIADFYKRLSNSSRSEFNNLFNKMWVVQSYSSYEFKRDESIPGFNTLKSELIKNRKEELKENYKLKAAHSQTLIQLVELIIMKIMSVKQN